MMCHASRHEALHGFLHRVWDAVPVGLRTEARQRLISVDDRLELVRLWHWVVSLHAVEPVPVVFIGRRTLRQQALGLLAAEGAVTSSAMEAARALTERRVSVMAEAPLPGALKVPSMVRTVFPVRAGRMKLQRRQRHLAEEHTLRQVTDPAELERLQREMLVPFANARHGEDAHPLSLDALRRMAERGRIDLLLHGEVEVGVHVGYPMEHDGKRLWVGSRVGYPECVFSDHRLLGDINTINFVHQLKRAETDGFDAYDMGLSPARPEGGLLQFKKRRGGDLDAWGAHETYSFMAPRGRAPDVFWATPLFSQEPEGLVLHVGIPAGRTPEEVHERYRELGFGGLASVAVHAAPLEPKGLEALTSHFHHTPIEVVSATT